MTEQDLAELELALWGKTGGTWEEWQLRRVEAFVDRLIAKHTDGVWAEGAALVAAMQQLTEALEEIADNDSDCGCLHDTDDCCVCVGVFCPQCIAEVALAKVARLAGGPHP